MHPSKRLAEIHLPACRDLGKADLGFAGWGSPGSGYLGDFELSGFWDLGFRVSGVVWPSSLRTFSGARVFWCKVLGVSGFGRVGCCRGMEQLGYVVSMALSQELGLRG